MEDFTTTFGNSAAQAAPVERAAFIRKTYLLLAAAVLVFIGVEAFLFSTGIAQVIASLLFAGGSIGWLVVLGLFMLISFLANRWAVSETSQAVQYLGLGIFILAEAIIFIPLLLIASYYSGDASVILKAGIVAMGLFAGLTFTVLVTRTISPGSPPYSRSGDLRHLASSLQVRSLALRSAMCSLLSWSHLPGRRYCIKHRTYYTTSTPNST